MTILAMRRHTESPMLNFMQFLLRTFRVRSLVQVMKMVKTTDIMRYPIAVMLWFELDIVRRIPTKITSERWNREEMRVWAKPYFDRGTAWSFTAKSRNISISKDGDIAWADEVLDTWMGDCRSTAILVKKDQDWKIKYFHVAIAVPNDAVDGYLKLIGKQGR